MGLVASEEELELFRVFHRADIYLKLDASAIEDENRATVTH